jgi:UDPglucose--hexose-1-phosphate uridylyltransferase
LTEVRIDPLTGLRAIIGDDTDWQPDGAGRPTGVPTRGPTLSPDAPDAEPEANRDLFWAGPARGAHEVLDSGPRPLTGLDAAELEALFEGWRERMRAHGEAAYLHLSAEESEPAHVGPLVQLFALDFVPAAIARERERFGAYATRTMGGNLLADLLQEEVRRRERVVAIDSDCVLISPFAARVPYQLMVVPRRPRLRFEDDGPTGAGSVHEALGRLSRALRGTPPLTLWVRTAPSGAEHFCWRLDILPRLMPAAGLELGTGVPYNPVAPEVVARRLRDA